MSSKCVKRTVPLTRFFEKEAVVPAQEPLPLSDLAILLMDVLSSKVH